MDIPEPLVDQRYCVLTTQGRVTGRRHTAELWFVPAEGGVFLMSGSGGLTQWCLNLQAEEQGVVRIGDRSWLARAAFLTVDDPDREQALATFAAKYLDASPDRASDGPARRDPGSGRSRTSGEVSGRLAAWRRAATVVHMVLTREL